MSQPKTLNTEYIAQVPQDCFLCHLVGEEAKNFNPQIFTVVAEKTVDVAPDLVAKLHIIGESHIVQLFHKGQSVFVEILSCVDPRDKGLECASCSFAQKSSHVVCGERFGTFAQINQTTIPANRHAFEPVSPNGPPLFTQSLALEFPGELKPRTMLLLSVYKDHLVWSSLHEYESKERITPLTSSTVVWLDGLD